MGRLAPKARQPLIQRGGEIAPGHGPSRKVSAEIEAMLRIRHDVSEESIFARLNTAAGDIRGEFHILRRKRLRRQR